MRALPSLVVALGTCFGVVQGAVPTSAEQQLKQLPGEDTSNPIPLWPDKPPRFLENAPAETVDGNGRIRIVSVPTLSPYLPPKELRTGMAIVVCAGGGYGGLDWKTHVVYAAQVFNAKGVAEIGLKYRSRPPHLVDNLIPQRVAHRFPPAKWPDLLLEWLSKIPID